MVDDEMRDEPDIGYLIMPGYEVSAARAVMAAVSHHSFGGRRAEAREGWLTT